MFKLIAFITICAVASAKPGLIAEQLITPSYEIQNNGYLGYSGYPLPLSSRYYQQGYLQSGYLQPGYLQSGYIPSTSSYNYKLGLGYSGLGLQYQYNKSPYYNYYY